MVIDADLTSSPAGLALREPDDFTSLKVLVHGTAHSRGTLAEALGPVGALDDRGNAFLRIEQLKQLAGDRARNEQWLTSFDAMVEYARDKGWVADDGQSLQAHCEWQEDAA